MLEYNSLATFDDINPALSIIQNTEDTIVPIV